MFVAGSTPCFELWLLLHIKNLDGFTPAEIDLLNANAKVSKKKTYIDKHLSDILPGGYNKTNIKAERFLANLEKAIERAEALDNPKEDFPSKLGSHVYKVVKAVTK